MNNLKVIDTQKVLEKNFKVYGDFENPLFLAKDVAEWIEYSKTGKGSYDVSKMLNTIDEDEKLVRTLFVSGQKREMWFLTEDGLYEVLMQSRKPIAKKFKKEVKKILKDLRLGYLKLNAEKQTTQWIETRKQGKLTRKSETDVIKELVEYAKNQGSKNAEMLYMTYSKLANKMAGIDKRDNATINQLNNLSLIENIILHCIRAGIEQEKHYKKIYQDCKARLVMFKDIAYLEAS